jgi:hypothetical protein
MILYFDPLPLDTTEFSFIEGEPGEAQLSAIFVPPYIQYWNFVKVVLN